MTTGCLPQEFEAPFRRLDAQGHSGRGTLDVPGRFGGMERLNGTFIKTNSLDAGMTQDGSTCRHGRLPGFSAVHSSGWGMIALAISREEMWDAPGTRLRGLIHRLLPGIISGGPGQSPRAAKLKVMIARGQCGPNGPH